MGITLGNITPLQAVEIADIRNLKSVRPTLRTPILTNPYEQINWLNRIEKDGSCHYQSIIYKEAFVGYTGIDKICHHNKNAEISLLIKPLYQNEGIGKEAINIILNTAFTDYKLDLVYGEAYSIYNSVDFWKKCGFTHDGTLRDRKIWNGKKYNSNMISITKKEFYEFNS